MDSDVTKDQRVLLDASARFIEQRCPLTAVRAAALADPERAAAYRRGAAELGWFSLLVPEALGGGTLSGNGVVDAALVAYERGRALQPIGFVPTNVVAYALASAGSEQQRSKILQALTAGEQTAAWVIGGAGIHDTATDTGVRATAAGAGFELTGSVPFIPDGSTAAWLLVVADTDSGVSQFLLPADAPGISVVPQESLDVTRRFAQVRLDRTPALVDDLVGPADHAAQLVAHELAIAAVLTAAESVGAMDHDFGMALRYAKDRVAFGRPIGSFQAVKHLLADTSLLLELCKAATIGAATSLGTDDGYGLEAASIAKALVGEHGIELAQNCFQVFGGIGFTWEHDQHLYLRRLTTDAALYGDPAWHRERLCQLSGLE